MAAPANTESIVAPAERGAALLVLPAELALALVLADELVDEADEAGDVAVLI